VNTSTSETILVLAMFNPGIKFGVSMTTPYKDTKNNAKCRNWGGLGWLGVTQGYQRCHHSSEFEGHFCCYKWQNASRNPYETVYTIRCGSKEHSISGYNFEESKPISRVPSKRFMYF